MRFVILIIGALAIATGGSFAGVIVPQHNGFEE